MSEPTPRRDSPTTLGGPLPGDEEPSVDGPRPLDLPRGWGAVSVRHVWRQAVRILVRRPEAIIGTTVLITLPYLVVRALLWEKLGTAVPYARAELDAAALLQHVAAHERVLFVLLTTFFFLLPWVLQAALARGVVHEMRGTPIPASESLRAGLGVRRWPAVLGVALIAPVAVVLGAAALSLSSNRPFSSSILDLRGMLPVLWAVMFCVVPVAVLEGRGWWSANHRAGVLALPDKQSSWRTAFSGMVLTGVPIGLGWAAVWGAFLLFGPGAGSPGNPMELLLVSGAVTILFAAFTAVTAAVAYSQLREAEERTLAARAAEVFG